jgi:hypothetical protein
MRAEEFGLREGERERGGARRGGDKWWGLQAYKMRLGLLTGPSPLSLQY